VALLFAAKGDVWQKEGEEALPARARACVVMARKCKYDLYLLEHLAKASPPLSAVIYGRSGALMGVCLVFDCEDETRTRLAQAGDTLKPVRARE